MSHSRLPAIIVIGGFLAACLASPLAAADHPLGALVRPAPLFTPRAYTPRVAGSLPASIDLSAQVPHVGDQGTYSSCVGWAVGYSLKTQEEQAERAWGVTTTAHQFSPLWIYNQIKIGTDGGSYVEDALNLLMNKGCDTLADFNPSNLTTLPNAASFANALPFHAISWNYVNPDATSVKTILSQGRPVIVALQVYPDFDAIAPGNEVYDQLYGASRGGHAVCIVGYDDAKGAVKFVNQWGVNWGLSGFGWISYAMLSNSTAVYGLFDVTDYVVPSQTVSASVVAGNEWTTEYLSRTASFTISRAASNTTAPLPVFYTMAGTATAGSDYSVSPGAGTVTIPAGSVSTLVTVTPVADSLYDPGETMTLTVTPDAGYAIGTPSASMLVYDQDLVFSATVTPGQYPGNAAPFAYRNITFIGAAMVPSGATVTVTAKVLIDLLPGTVLASGSTFDAKIL